MNVSYIYPQWQKAKRTLVELIEENPKQVRRIVDEFFMRYVFEVGTYQIVEWDHMSATRTLIEGDILYGAARRIADEIVAKGLYMVQKTPEPIFPGNRREKIEHRVLVLGVPPFGVGPGTRERDDKRRGT